MDGRDEKERKRERESDTFRAATPRGVSVILRRAVPCGSHTFLVIRARRDISVNDRPLVFFSHNLSAVSRPPFSVPRTPGDARTDNLSLVRRNEWKLIKRNDNVAREKRGEMYASRVGL